MISSLILIAALAQCPGGVCQARTVERQVTRSVVVKRVVAAEPVRTVVKSVRVHRVRLLHRLFR